MNTVRYDLRRVKEENMHYYESGEESGLQLIFVPGGLNPGIWRHQVKYFSRRFRTISFRPTVSFRDYEGERSALENVLEQEHVDNAVLISHVFGNPLIQEFEDHGKVVSTVLTSPRRRIKERPRKLLKWIYRLSTRSPKISKKLFFSADTEYRVVKDFLSDLEEPEPADLKTFIQGYRVSRPEKKALVIHPEDDRFSNLEFGKELKPLASISALKNSGTFSFYEKPQEYNKALHDFLETLKEEVEAEEIMKLRKNNRSLLEFNRSEKKGTEKNREEVRRVKV